MKDTKNRHNRVLYYQINATRKIKHRMSHISKVIHSSYPVFSLSRVKIQLSQLLGDTETFVHLPTLVKHDFIHEKIGQIAVTS